LAKKGFDPRFGARPLQRTIETLLTAPLAEFLLENSKSQKLRNFGKFDG
jgi:ATP-dependent Clp protease ATP-binding subunit ClpA